MPRRRSNYRNSVSPPPSHRESPQAASPPARRRYSTSEVSHPKYSPPGAISPPYHRPREDARDPRSRSGYPPPVPVTAGSSSPHAGAPRSEWIRPAGYPSGRQRPQSTSTTSSPHRKSPVTSDRHGPLSSESHERRPRQTPAASGHSPPAHPGGNLNVAESFFSKFPTSFATYAGIRALSDHADKAKEWVGWLNNVNGAPVEIKLLSARVNTARDTIQQIQDSLEARPDMIEGEAGQTLKSQTEDAIDSTSGTLKKVTKLLSSFSGTAQQDGTVLGRSEGFWHSYSYKHEGEEQVKATDAELQQQLMTLSTLMSNIYARALKEAGLASPNSATPNSAATPSQSTRLQEATGDVGTSDEGSKSASGPKSTHEQTASDNPTLPSSNPAMMASPDIAIIQDPRSSTNTAPAPAPAPSPSPLALDGASTSYESPGHSHHPEANAANPTPDPRDILLDAAWDGDLKAVTRALRKADAASCDHRGLTALHLAAERDNMAVAMLLLDRDADVHARADGGCMPLHLAARYASADTVEMLVERGRADPNSRTSDGRTALHYAARAAADGDGERRDVIRTLRDLGVDPTLRNRKGETARDVAQKRDHWDAAATLRRAEKWWEEEHRQNHQNQRGNWLQRHGFMK